MATPLESMRTVARRLAPLKIPFVFVGGAAVSLLVDRPDLTDFRPTRDVDVVVAVVTRNDYAKLETILREAGFQHDMSEDAPICRWIVEGCRVDIMPQESAFLGMNSKWFPEVMEFAHQVDLGESCTARVITPPLFLATKLQAFNDRGEADYYESKDLEDIVTLVHGRNSIVGDVAASPTPIRQFVSQSFADLLTRADFGDALPGHLSTLYGARQQVALVRDRLQQIARLDLHLT